jgi:hypothetical protein
MQLLQRSISSLLVTTSNAMTKLSPAAQAVLDAAMASAIQNLHGTYERDIAAALRAAARQIEPTMEERTTNPAARGPGFFNGISCAAAQLLAIAAELDPPP